MQTCSLHYSFNNLHNMFLEYNFVLFIITPLHQLIAWTINCIYVHTNFNNLCYWNIEVICVQTNL